MGLSRLRSEFALIYGSLSLILWGTALIAPLNAGATLTAGLSYCGLLAATGVSAYRYGRLNGGNPKQASNATIAANLFITLMVVRIILEAFYLASLAAFSQGEPLDRATEHWFSTTWSLQVAVNFGLAFIGIRILAPLAVSRGAKAFAHTTFS